MAANLTQFEFRATPRQAEVSTALPDSNAGGNHGEQSGVEVWLVVTNIGAKGLPGKRPTACLAAKSGDGVGTTLCAVAPKTNVEVRLRVEVPGAGTVGATSWFEHQESPFREDLRPSSEVRTGLNQFGVTSFGDSSHRHQQRTKPVHNGLESWLRLNRRSGRLMRIMLFKYCLCLCWVLASCAAAPTEEVDPVFSETWVVGSDLDNSPFASVDGDGKPIGRDVEMMVKLAERCGARIEWKRMPFDELLGSVRAGEVDIVCATMGITDERARVVQFSSPYFVTEIAVVLRAGFGAGPTLEQRLTGHRVHAARGTTSQVAVEQLLPAAELFLASKGALTSASLLTQGLVAALVMDRPAAEAIALQSHGMLVVAEERLAAENYALVFSTTRTDRLCERLNEALRELGSRGDWEQLDREYGLVPEPSGPLQRQRSDASQN